MASELYALGWGYDQTEIGKRVRVIEDLYAPGDPEPPTLETLGALPYPIYILVRAGEDAVDGEKFAKFPGVFRRVFTAGPIAVFEIDRSACRGAASGVSAQGAARYP
jgi:hypothetical protein